MASEIDKLALVISNGFKLQGKQTAELISVVKSSYKPNVTVLAPKAPNVNVPEIKIPKIEIPDITVPMPQVDLSKIEASFKDFVKAQKVPETKTKKVATIIDSLKGKSEGTIQDVDKLIAAIEKSKPSEQKNSKEMLELLEEMRNIKHMAQPKSGGAMGPSKIYFRNKTGTVVNPATEDKQDDIISALDSDDTFAFVAQSLLGEILKELRINNQHLSLQNEVTFKESDMEK